MYELYSARLRNTQGELEVFEYDQFPEAFRNQVFFILTDYVNRIGSTTDEKQATWKLLHGLFCREKGLKSMRIGSAGFYAAEEDYIETYISRSTSEDLLDFIDYAFHCISSTDFCQQLQCFSYHCNPRAVAEESIDDLNQRFKQHSLGYSFDGQLMRVDSFVIHNEFIKPALCLLNSQEFSGAEAEYRSAFTERRNNDNKNAILNAVKAFESVMKVICAQKRYPYDSQKDTAKKLIDILKTNKFFPEYMESHLNAVCSTLESGVPVVRNKEAGHGQGTEIKEVPDYLVDYVLGLVAVNIVFLVNIYNSNK